MNTKDTPILPFAATNAYLKGTLKPKAMAQADEILAQCDFSKEAIEGLQTVPPADFAPSINDLSKRLSDRTGSSEIIPIPTEKLMINFGQIAAIAAAVVVVGMAAWVLTSPKIDFFNSLRSQMAFEKTTPQPTADTLSTEALQGAGSVVFNEDGTPIIIKKDSTTAQTTPTTTGNASVAAADAASASIIYTPNAALPTATEDAEIINKTERKDNATTTQLETDAAKLQAAEAKRKATATQRTLPAPIVNNTNQQNTNGYDNNAQYGGKTIENVTTTNEKSANMPTATAQFVGGSGALQTYLITNSAYPRKLADAPDKPQGKVVVSFDVNEKGKVENVYVVRGLNELLDKKAIAAVKNMPRWLPANKNGKPMKSRQTVSFDFVP